jgi:hypothetical protein
MVSIAGLAGSRNAEAAAVAPASYVYEYAPGGGTPAYSDPDLSKLTDGKTGSTDYNDTTWVGIYQGAPGAGVIIFTFALPETITDVAINFLQDGAASIAVSPAVSIYELTGGPMNQVDYSPANFSVDPSEGFVHFSGSWTGTQLVVGIGFDNLTVPFLNEVQFSNADTTPTDPPPVDPTPVDSSAAPEPGSAGLAFAGLIIAVALSRTKGFIRRMRTSSGVC